VLASIGGRVWLQGSPGGGTVVVVEVPIISAAD
jgi:signal transduction histidine kinase